MAVSVSPVIVTPARRARTVVRVSPREFTDAELVARCAAGEDQALALLYDRFGRRCYAVALRVIGDAAFAEDVVQEAFLDLWRQAKRFDQARASVSAYLLTFVHRRAVDLVRREESRPQRGADVDVLSERPAGDADLTGQVVAQEQRVRVRASLSGLSPAHAEVVELAYFAGLSQSEIAARIGEPLGTVKSRTHAALQQLRELLGKDLA